MHLPKTPEQLSDTALEVLIRDAANVASNRPTMRPFLKQFLAAALDEIKLEELHKRPAKVPA